MDRQISAADSLQLKIEQLEQLQTEQLSDLKSSAVALMGSFSPAQILRSTLKDITTSPDLKAAAIDTAMGIGAGFLGRKLYVSNSNNIFRKITGSAVQFFVTTFVKNKMSRLRDIKVENK